MISNSNRSGAVPTGPEKKDQRDQTPRSGAVGDRPPKDGQIVTKSPVKVQVREGRLVLTDTK